jgi:mannose-6-phosphate isomerase-like protein (cupin superfamily)
MQKIITQQPERKNFNNPDEVKNTPNSKMETIKLGNTTFMKQTFQPGWKWTKDIKPLMKTELCPLHHKGVLLSGKMHLVIENGKELDLMPDDATIIPPGHDAWVVGNEPAIFISFE